MDNQGKEGSFKWIFVIMIVSLIIASLWHSFTFIKNTAHSILDPTAGALLNWNITLGMAVLVLIIAGFMTVLQKYATDQKSLKEIKEEHKKLSKEAKEFRNDPQKMMEFNKKMIPMSLKMFKMSMRPMIYTAIPLILFFRWFIDYFSVIPEFRFFGFLSWFWFYLLGSIIFSSILRKIFKVV